MQASEPALEQASEQALEQASELASEQESEQESERASELELAPELATESEEGSEGMESQLAPQKSRTEQSSLTAVSPEPCSTGSGRCSSQYHRSCTKHRLELGYRPHDHLRTRRMKAKAFHRSAGLPYSVSDLVLGLVAESERPSERTSEQQSVPQLAGKAYPERRQSSSNRSNDPTEEFPALCRTDSCR